jgi:hypothetical protein
MYSSPFPGLDKPPAGMRFGRSRDGLPAAARGSPAMIGSGVVEEPLRQRLAVILGLQSAPRGRSAIACFSHFCFLFPFAFYSLSSQI